MVPWNYYVTNHKEPHNQQVGAVNSMYITHIRDPIEILNVKDMFLLMIFLMVLKFILKIVTSYKKSIVRQYNPPTVPIAITQANPMRHV